MRTRVLAASGRQPVKVLACFGLLALLAALVLLDPPSALGATPNDAFAVQSGVGGDEHLKRVDLTSGAITDVGFTEKVGIDALALAPGGASLWGINDTMNKHELVRISMASGIVQQEIPLTVDPAAPGLTFTCDGKLWMSSGGPLDPPFNFYEINPADGTTTLKGNQLIFGNAERVPALTAEGNTVYGLVAKEGSDLLATVNTSDGSLTAVGTLDTEVIGGGGLDFDASGQLWAIDEGSGTTQGKAFKVDKTTGDASSFVNVATGFSNLAIAGPHGCAGPPPNVVPEMFIDNVRADEGNTGTKEVDVVVTMSSATTGTVTVDYATADITATAGADYVAKNGTLTFAPGETSKPIKVEVRGDTIDEADETFRVTLSNASGATIADDTARVTIVDDDAGGYWLVAADGGIFAFNLPFHGSTGGQKLNQPIVAMGARPNDDGYWLVAADGGVFAFGNSAFHGSTGGLSLNRPIVNMATTPSGLGYWMVAGDGGIFAFGDAAFHGSTGGIRLNQPIVDMEPTPTGNGYWMVASDGGIFAFGDAAFHGSTGGITLNQPIVAMAATPTGGGYYLIASDGGVFAFGDATFQGSTGGQKLNQPIIDAAGTPSGDGYWFVASDGGVFAFGDATFQGSTGGIRLNSPIVGMAS